MFLSNCFRFFIGILCLEIVLCLTCNHTEKELIWRCTSRYPRAILELFEDTIVKSKDFYTIYTDKDDSIMFLSHHKQELVLTNCETLRTSRDYVLSCEEQADNPFWLSHKLRGEMHCAYDMYLHFAEALSKYCNYTTSVEVKSYIIGYNGNYSTGARKAKNVSDIIHLHVFFTVLLFSLTFGIFANEC